MDNVILMKLEIFLALIMFLTRETIQGVNEKHLLHYLFVENHYNPLERPVENESHPIAVSFAIVLQQIIDVDEKNQILYSNIWLQMVFRKSLKVEKVNDLKNGLSRTITKCIPNLTVSGFIGDVHLVSHGKVFNEALTSPLPQVTRRPLALQHEQYCKTWIDVNLRWDPREFGGIEAIRVPASHIWKPDILMYNSADKAFDATYHTNVIVSYDGNCSWIPPGMFKSTCAIDIAWFPFDEQKCFLKFGSWTHDGRQLDLRLDEKLGGNGDTSNFIRNGEWELIGLPGRRNEKSYVCCPERYIDITFTLHIRRRTLYYGFNIIIPCVLISSMSLLLFLLPPDSGEKISLGRQRIKGGVTILLSLMVFLLLVAETMPPTSDAVPLIGIYFCCIMIMCSLSVMFTVIVLNFHYRGPDTRKLPKWVHTWVNGWLACLLQMRKPGRNNKDQQRDYVHRARLRDSMLQERQARSLLGDVLDTEEEMRLVNGMFGAGAKREETTFTATPNTHELLAILREVRRITMKCKREEEEIELKCEWRFAAMVIDRLCLWICLTFTLISTGVVMFSAPHLAA